MKRSGDYGLQRKTIRKRWHAKLQEVKTELRRRMHDPIPEQGRYLQRVLAGHFRYYGVPTNDRLSAFRYQVGRLWRRSLQRRSQKNRMTWKRMDRYIDGWFPSARICHPWPSERFDVTT